MIASALPTLADSRDSVGRTGRAASDAGPPAQGKMEGGRLLGHSISSVTEEYGSLARRGKVGITTSESTYTAWIL